MSDAFDATIRRTSQPLPQSLGELRQERAEAEALRSGSQSGSFHWQQWSQRIADIDSAIGAARSLPLFGRAAVAIPLPIIDAAYAERLAGGTESNVLDYKADLPFSRKNDQNARSELLKDMLSIANTVTDGLGHLFYGRTETGSLRSVSVELDDANLQQWAENAIEPPMSFSLHNVLLSGSRVCVIVIRPARRRPHVAKATVTKIGPLHEGQVWFRRGSKNTIATYDDLHRLFRDEAVGPLRFESGRASGYVLLEDWFRSLRRDLFLGRITHQDELLGKGYEIARHPLTSQEIIVGPDALLFLKPPQTSRT